ncbi:MAG TPA: MFS transporter [Gaiellaceae bacterium]
MRLTLPFATAVALAAAVAVAFSDSSIVVLALPELYFHFKTSIVGVSWVITAYNLVVALGALALIPLVGRFPRAEAASGLVLFLGASLGCGLAWSLPALFTFRCLQGAGAALLLAGSLPILSALTGSAKRGTALWTAAGAVGVAVGPALGGVLTELFDWRAIFFAQAPVAALGIAATIHRHVRTLPERKTSRRGPLTANAALVFLFGAIVGALFLAVLLIVTAWQFTPITGALVVSALPLAGLVTSRLSRSLSVAEGVVSGAVLLAAGLVALALLPESSAAYAVPALAFCGAGFGLAVPPLTRASVDEQDLGRSATLSVGARHIGLVLGLLAIAPVLASTVSTAGEQATTNATKTILDARLPLTKKVPIALAIRDEFDRAQDGAIPDLAKPFEDAGAGDDERVRTAEDQLLTAVRAPLTRSFRPGFAIAALFGAAAALPLLLLRRRRTA